MHVALGVTDEEWTRALDGLPEPLRDIYFGAPYHRLHAYGELEVSFDIVEDGEERLLVPGLRAAIPGAPEFFDLSTCNGYGGPLATTGSPLFLNRAWAAWSREAAKAGLVAAFFRLNPMVENHRFLSGEALVADNRETVLLDLTSGVAAALQHADGRCRNMLSKAQRLGTVVTWNRVEAWGEFEALYGTAMERLRADPALRFPPSFFAGLRALPGADLATVHDTKGLASAAVFLRGSGCYHYHVSARRPDSENHLTTLLLARALERAADLGLTALHLGGGASVSPEDRLLRFKSSFGGRRLTFQVARVIADSSRFDALMRAWKVKEGTAPSWLLGYRQPHRVS